MVNRWTLVDPATDEEWEFPLNPNQMTSPHPPKNHQIFARGIGNNSSSSNGISRVLAFRQQPYEWSFSGAIRDEQQYQDFLTWTRKTGRLELTDHFLRTWQIRIDSVDLEEQRPTARRSHRFTYTVKAIIYGRVTTP
jgi:hypothetical protein